MQLLAIMEPLWGWLMGREASREVQNQPDECQRRRNGSRRSFLLVLLWGSHVVLVEPAEVAAFISLLSPPISSLSIHLACVCNRGFSWVPISLCRWLVEQVYGPSRPSLNPPGVFRVPSGASQHRHRLLHNKSGLAVQRSAAFFAPFPMALGSEGSCHHRPSQLFAAGGA